jgi:hypothetical protein
MVPADIQRMLEQHRNVAPDDVEEIQRGLRAGTCSIAAWSPGYARGPELLATYKIKGWSVSRFDTEHARRLRGDTERLCEKLSVAGDVRCRLWSFELERGRHLLLVESAGPGDLLGVLHTVSRTKTTPEEWAALWGTDVESERAYRQLGAQMIKSDDPSGDAS